jgi:DNA-binding transcriptional MerR regulator
MIYNRDSWGRYDNEMAGEDGFSGACNNADGDLEVCACSNLLRIKSLIPLFLPKDYKLSNNSIEELIIVNKLECLYRNCTTSNRVYKQSKMVDGNYCPNTMCVQINDIDITESKIGSLVNKQECGLGVKLTNDPSNNVTVQPTTPGLTLDEVKALLEQQKKESDAKIQQLLDQAKQQQQQQPEQTTIQPVTENSNKQKLFQYAMIGIIVIVLILVIIFAI